MKKVNFNNWDFSKITNFYGIKWYNTVDTVLEEISFDNAILPTNCNGLLKDYANLSKISFKNTDTSVVTDMGSMFEGTTLLTTVDLSSFTFDNVTELTDIFKDSGLTSGYVKNNQDASLLNGVIGSNIFTVKPSN